MADITKLVDRTLPSNQRYVTFTSDELDDGDVIQVTESLGRPADTLRITTVQGSDLKIRLNTQVTVYPRRAYPEQQPYGWYQNGEQLLASGIQFDTGVGEILVGSATGVVDYEINDLPITDLEVNFSTASGLFHLTLS